MSFASRLREQRQRMNLTQAELANALGVTKSAIGNYETGLNSPKAEILFRVFDVLQCDANYLFQDEMTDILEETASPDEMENLVKKYRRLDSISQKIVLSIIEMELNRTTFSRTTETNKDDKFTSPNYLYLPLSEQPASAGTGVYLGPEAFCTIKVVENAKTRRAAFCVRVSGDSMEPIYWDRDIVMVSKEPVERDDIALVTLDGCGYIKRIGEMRLISENKRYKPIPFDENVIVNGRVIGLLDPDWILD